MAATKIKEYLFGLNRAMCNGVGLKDGRVLTLVQNKIGMTEEQAVMNFILMKNEKVLPETDEAKKLIESDAFLKKVQEAAENTKKQVVEGEKVRLETEKIINALKKELEEEKGKNEEITKEKENLLKTVKILQDEKAALETRLKVK